MRKRTHQQRRSCVRTHTLTSKKSGCLCRNVKPDRVSEVTERDKGRGGTRAVESVVSDMRERDSDERVQQTESGEERRKCKSVRGSPDTTHNSQRPALMKMKAISIKNILDAYEYTN